MKRSQHTFIPVYRAPATPSPMVARPAPVRHGDADDDAMWAYAGLCVLFCVYVCML